MESTCPKCNGRVFIEETEIGFTMFHSFPKGTGCELIR